MRRILDGIYLYCGALAALFLSLIAVTILAQIVGRLFAITIDSVESSGFCLAATTFLGLAHTLKSGQHIQINLFIRHLKGRAAQAAQLWCCGVATPHSTLLLLDKSSLFVFVVVSMWCVPLSTPLII